MYPQRELWLHDMRIKLPLRYAPYWRDITFGRHIGYQKRVTATYWVARYRTRAGSYQQKRLGETDDVEAADGKDILTYDQAIEQAKAWFALPELLPSAAPDWRIQTSKSLMICPIGQEFTIGHALQDFVEWKRLTSAKSHIDVLLTMINGHIVPRLASLPARDLTGDAIRHFVKSILQTPPKRGNRRQEPPVAIETLDDEALRKRKKTVNMMLSVIRGALRMAWENEKFDDDRIWRRIGRFRGVDRPRMLHLSRMECRALLAASRPDLRQLVLGALYTGCRATELLRMRCMHVGRDGYGVYVMPAKTSKARFVFLPDEGMAWFLALAKGRDPGDPVFLMRNGHAWRGANYRLLFREAVKAAGLPTTFAFHGLRHTYASQLVQSGTPVFVVSDQLGHANPTTVMRTYGHLSPQIRESEVRQRFTTLDRRNATSAKQQVRKLQRWRSSLHGADWRTYAKITDLSSRTNTEALM
jgi:integrase